MNTIIHDTTIVSPLGGQVRVRHHHSLVLEAGRVAALAPARHFDRRLADDEFDEIIRGERYVVIPGLVNTHHHLYQSLTRCLPAAQNDRLFDWLLKLYERWRHLDYHAVHMAAQVSIAELLLHGCTTTSDHFYMLPPGSDVRMEAVLDAAAELGIRLHLCRGSMSLGQSGGGLPPDDCVERDADVLADCQRVLDQYHDKSALALRRIDLAPCSPFNVTRELMRDTRDLARQHGVLLHTHLAETLEEEAYCLEKYGCRPVRYLEDLDWLGPDVYLAHCVYLNDEEIALLAQTKTGVSHNPTSNLRLGSGIAPLRKLLAAGVPVGLGVDGSSSNDGGNLLAAAKQTLLLARVLPVLEGTKGPRNQRTDGDEGPRASARADVLVEKTPEPLMPVAEAFKLATIGGAACLRREELGHLNPGAAADLAMFRTDDIALAGAFAQDPLAALILCDAPRADRVFVAGREVVRDGRIVALDETALGAEFNDLVAKRFRV
ncbi:MAG: amidohydrolase family protein [Phycisphaerae bacterium]|nr:amidohydrolase family protein [Phycisphaerae bacterium]